MCEVVINEIQIIPIKPHNGLVGFASCIINNQFYAGNIAIYTSLSSPLGFRLVFPQKKLASGLVVDCFYPITKEPGDAVSKAIIKKYIELMENFHYVE
jgi:stage V sporulation protein G